MNLPAANDQPRGSPVGKPACVGRNTREVGHVVHLDALVGGTDPAAVSGALLEDDGVAAAVADREQGAADAVVLLVDLLHGEESQLDDRGGGLGIGAAIVIGGRGVRHLIVDGGFGDDGVVQQDELLPILAGHGDGLANVAVPLVAVHGLQAKGSQLARRHSRPGRCTRRYDMPYTCFSMYRHHRPCSG